MVVCDSIHSDTDACKIKREIGKYIREREVRI